MQSKVLKFIGFILALQFSQVERVVGIGTQSKMDAARHIVNLKNGTLVVRLMKKQELVDAFLVRGDTTSANIIIEQQRVKNIKQMKAFKEAYSFSNLLFFFSHDSKIILDQNFEKPVFLNDRLEKDADLIVTGKLFMCEIGTTDGLDISAITISDSSFTQLTPPFPYMVRKFKDTFWERTDNKVITKLNIKLNTFLLVKVPIITGIKP